MSGALTQERSSFSKWMQAVRPFASTATIAPVLIGVMLVMAFYEGPVDWFLIPFVLFGAILIHTGGNLISEYFDYKHNVDRDDTFGSSRVLVEDILTTKQIKRGAFVTFIIGIALGSVAILVRQDLVILWIGLVGLFCGYMYGAKPFQLKYNALGDVAIFLAFGPLMVLGTYYALTGDMNYDVMLAAIPISFLVVAILHANNTRDIKHDGEANITTLAMKLGLKGSKVYYAFLVLGSYVVLAVLVALKFLPIWTLIALISLPPAIGNLKMMSKAEIEQPENIKNLDEMTAKHHLLFGLTMSIGLLVAALV